ncbi:MAG TPA: hypothetical protein PK493_11640, partial [Pseudomonadota bacterium]|nr:hypothetical protein [Pseudomonadota bacterium]
MTDGSSRDPEPEQRKAPGGKEPLLLLPDADLLGLATALAQSSATGAVSAAQLPVDILDGIRQRILRPGTVRRPLHPLLPASCRVTEMEVSDYREKALTVGIVAD